MRPSWRPWPSGRWCSGRPSAWAKVGARCGAAAWPWAWRCSAAICRAPCWRRWLRFSSSAPPAGDCARSGRGFWPPPPSRWSWAPGAGSPCCGRSPSPSVAPGSWRAKRASGRSIPASWSGFCGRTRWACPCRASVSGPSAGSESGCSCTASGWARWCRPPRCWRSGGVLRVWPAPWSWPRWSCCWRPPASTRRCGSSCVRSSPSCAIPSKLAAPAALLLAFGGAVMVERWLARPGGVRKLCLWVAGLGAAGALVGPLVQSWLARQADASADIIALAARDLRQATLRVALLAGAGALLFWLVERGRLPVARAVAGLGRAAVSRRVRSHHQRRLDASSRRGAPSDLPSRSRPARAAGHAPGRGLERAAGPGPGGVFRRAAPARVLAAPDDQCDLPCERARPVRPLLGRGRRRDGRDVGRESVGPGRGDGQRSRAGRARVARALVGSTPCKAVASCP